MSFKSIQASLTKPSVQISRRTKDSKDLILFSPKMKDFDIENNF